MTANTASLNQIQNEVERELQNALEHMEAALEAVQPVDRLSPCPEMLRPIRDIIEHIRVEQTHPS